MSLANGSPAASPPVEREPLRGPFGAKAIYLGRISNIEIGLDYSWLIIFGLVTYSLGKQFIHDYEDWPRAVAWVTATFTSLLFFTSILLHELGHSLTSNALGLPIKSITLFIFGGVARLSREPDRPRDEFLIAIAGPAVSVVLGAGFLGLSHYIGGGSLGVEVAGAICAWVGQINLTLVVFNCIPGFPLDGGRVLRSIIWGVTNNYNKATRIAAAGGQIFAYLLIGVGIVAAFGGQFQGIWLAMIGWFLLNAARSSVSQIIFRDSLSSVRVKEVCDRDFKRVSGAMSVAQLIEGPILRQGLRTFFVESMDRVIGLVTLHQVKEVPEDERESTPLQAIAAPIDRLHSLEPDETLIEALRKLDEEGVNQLPVIEDDHVVGVLNRESVLRIVRNFLELGRR